MLEGDELHSGQDSSNKPQHTKKDAARARSNDPTADKAVGDALRSVYQAAVNEDVPADLLDLLGKLG